MKKSDLYRVAADSTYFRRASTVMNWVSWILGLIDGEQFYISMTFLFKNRNKKNAKGHCSMLKSGTMTLVNIFCLIVNNLKRKRNVRENDD